MKKVCRSTLVFFILLITFSFLIIISHNTKALSYSGEDLALAILTDPFTLISSYYEDRDPSGYRQAAVFYSLGTMIPTDGDTFLLLSTGIAGSNPVTTNQENPGDERGTWFVKQNTNPRDYAKLTMNLKVPDYMYYLYYDVQFFSSEYPEYIGTLYDDKLTITVNSPSNGVSKFIMNVNSGYFVLDSNSIPGTGFDIFALDGNPLNADLVDTTPKNPGADAGATALIPVGGSIHPVTPGENITVLIHIEDGKDNLFDSAAFIDNLRFSGYAEANIIARKTVIDENGGEIEAGDILKYTITISNTGKAVQYDNPGPEFVDYIPENTTYVNNSAYSAYGTIGFDELENRITWNGSIPAESSIVLEFKVKIDDDALNGAAISNQGTVYWDSNGDRINDAILLTDDPYVSGNENPTIIYVYTFDYPKDVTETFSDDRSGTNASQSYLSRIWFDTTFCTQPSSSFEVDKYYHYSTAGAFKTKLRLFDSPQYWNYNLNTLENADMTWWEVWFSCGDTSEDYDLYLSLQDNSGQDIAKIRLDYTKAAPKPMDHLLELFYWDPVEGWCRLNSDFYGGYLRSSWYKLRIEKNGENLINYTLGRVRRPLLDFKTGGALSGSFSDFKKVEWSSTKNPILCPIFFWDDHKIGLTYLD